MRDSSSKLNAVKNLTAIGIGLVALSVASASFAAASEDSDTYTWSAQLVSLDKIAGTLTVKARVVENPDVAMSNQLHAGDKAMLTWSGLSFGAGVRAVVPGNKTQFDRLTMPVDFVASEMDGRYVSFKVPISSENIATIETLEPGAWVTATSPAHPGNASQVIIKIRRYDDAS